MTQVFCTGHNSKTCENISKPMIPLEKELMELQIPPMRAESDFILRVKIVFNPFGKNLKIYPIEHKLAITILLYVGI